MPECRRSMVAGGTFFFTVVTYHRQPILVTEESRSILRSAWINVMERYPFKTDAICLLPDHIHCIWTLPEEDLNYSLRWGEIKKLFTKRYLKQTGAEIIPRAPHESRIKRGEAFVWQRRFWEHTIRDEKDLTMHLDYIHYNPVKHGLVKKVKNWPWSSFHRYIRMGYYEEEWGDSIEKTVNNLAGGE